MRYLRCSCSVNSPSLILRILTLAHFVLNLLALRVHSAFVVDRSRCAVVLSARFSWHSAILIQWILCKKHYAKINQLKNKQVFNELKQKLDERKMWIRCKTANNNNYCIIYVNVCYGCCGAFVEGLGISYNIWMLIFDFCSCACACSINK